MRKFTLLCIVLGLAILNYSLCARGLNSHWADGLQTIAERHIESEGPGFALALIQDGKLVYKGGFGGANLAKDEAIESDSSFRLASVSKPITALAALKLVDDGKLKLADPVSEYLPSFPYSKVTVEHLLHHTSGLPHYRDFPVRFAEQSKRPVNRDSLAMLVKLKQELAFRPGSAFDYNNLGYDLLALVIAAASDQPFHSYMEEGLFKPLGMMNTVVVSSESASKIKKRVLGYSYDEEEEEFYLDDEDALNELVGAGGIYSTLDDMVKLSEALLAGKVLREETLEAAWTPAALTGGGESTYGYGWDVDAEEVEGEQGVLIVGHEGSWVGFDTLLELRPGNKDAYIALTNGGVDLDVVLDEFLDALR